MQDFVHSEKTIQFWKVSGTILDTNKYSETKVTSSGGGGYVGSQGGHISAPKISSSSTLNHEFWIKTDEGKEISIKLKNIDIPLRPDQKITVLSAARKDNNNGYYCKLINHNSDTIHEITNCTELNNLLRLENPTGKSLLLALATLAVIGWLFGSWNLALPLAATIVVARAIIKYKKISKLKSRLNQHINTIVGSLRA